MDIPDGGGTEASARGDEHGETPAPDERTVEVTVRGVLGLSDRAEARLRQVLQEFTDEVAREASRIEEGGRARVLSDPETTASNIDDAYWAVRRPRIIEPEPPPAPSTMKRAARVGTALIGPVWGTMLGFLHSYLQVAACTAAGVFFLIGTMWLMWGNNE
jgi:hypothetical protein